MRQGLIDLLQNAVFSEPTDEMVVVKDIEMFRFVEYFIKVVHIS